MHTQDPHIFEGWRTKHQLKLMYGDDNVVNSIVEAKVQSGHWREHPDLPGDSHMLLYYVAVLASVDANQPS